MKLTKKTKVGGDRAPPLQCSVYSFAKSGAYATGKLGTALTLQRLWYKALHRKLNAAAE